MQRFEFIFNRNHIDNIHPASGKCWLADIFDFQPVPTSAWVDLILERLKQFDCVKKGWVLSGFPETKEQAVALQAVGIYPKHYSKFNEIYIFAVFVKVRK